MSTELDEDLLHTLHNSSTNEGVAKNEEMKTINLESFIVPQETRRAVSTKQEPRRTSFKKNRNCSSRRSRRSSYYDDKYNSRYDCC